MEEHEQKLRARAEKPARDRGDPPKNPTKRDACKHLYDNDAESP